MAVKRTCSRREALAAVGYYLALSSLPALPTIAHGESSDDALRELVYSLPIKDFDYYGPIETYARLRRLYYNARANGLCFERLSKHYLASNEAWAAETCLAVGYGWWRAESSQAARLKVARLGQKFAGKIIGDFPDSPVGYCWQAVFVGVEALTLGILDALHLIPNYQKALARVNAINPAYFYGFSTLLLAKILLKTPPKPLSIGNLEDAQQLLEQGRPMQQGKLAIWYLFYAELLYQTQGLDAALAKLNEMRDQVKPENVATAVILDQTLFDAAYFERVLRENRYNKYTWDPIMIPAKPTPAKDLLKYGLKVEDI